VIVAVVVVIVTAIAVWTLAPHDSKDLTSAPRPEVERSPVEKAEPTDGPRELTDMRELGYIVEEEAEAADETHPTEFGEGRIAARRLQHLAVSLEDSGDLEAAESAYRSAIAADPTFVPPHYGLAELLRQTGRFDEADREFWIAVDGGLVDPPVGIVKVATQYRNLGEIERAGRILDEGRRRYPENADIWLHFGAFFGEIGDYERSAKALEKAVSFAPDDPLGYRNLAAAQVALGNRETALRTLEEGLQRDPENTEIIEMLNRLREATQP
jgi:tetratricopeptide (TPR) repeat protein